MGYFEEEFIKDASKRSLGLLGLDKMNGVCFSENYFKSKLTDSTIDPNANVSGISPNNYLSEMAKPYAKYYFFKKLYEKGKELYEDFTLDSIWEGSIYLHDATKLQPYCFGVSATEIATLGRPYSPLPALPPKRLESFMGQLTEFIMDCSQEFAGAIAITDLVPWMAWFIEKNKGHEGPFTSVEGFTEDGNIIESDPYYIDKGSYSDKDIENIFQSFVHVLNNSFRVGGDSPFTNISINSKKVYYDIFEHYIFPDGKTVDDLWETIKWVQKIIVQFMSKGRPDGIPYRFPILTANFKADESEMESDWFDYVAKSNSKGFLNVNFAERFAMCCRLQLDFDFKQNSFGGGGVKVGSMRVANLNLPRLAHRAMVDFFDNGMEGRPEDYYLEQVKIYTEEAMKILHAYYKVFLELIDMGYLKFFKEPAKWFTPKMFFATVGFCGIYDAAEILYPEEVLKFRPTLGYLSQPKKSSFENKIELMGKTVNMLVDLTKTASNGIKYNVEEVPSESAAGTMARFNKDLGETKEYYSNQFLPLELNIPLPIRIDVESHLQSKLTGGGMTFLNFDAELTPEQSLDIHKRMMKKGFTGQFCINYGFSQCGDCLTVKNGEIKSCPKCNSENMDYYTRVVGYLAKKKNACESKQSEINVRHLYSMTT